MRIFPWLLLNALFCGVACAQPLAMSFTYKQQTQPTRVKLADVLQQLKDHYKVDILYADQFITNQYVTASLVRLNDKLELNLKRILPAAGLRYIEQKAGTFLLIPIEKAPEPKPASDAPKAEASNTFPALNEQLREEAHLIRDEKRVMRSVSGIVTDDKKEPLPGVSVLIKGTQKGTITDAEGRFVFQDLLKDEEVLVFSYVGYQRQEVQVGTETRLNVVLLTDNKELDEVVVIAYGTANRREVSTAISSIGSKDIADKPVVNAVEALQGLMPGVNIQQGTAAPGDSPQIKIRGMGSLGAGNAPLYVVDGVPLASPSSFNQINPSDIKSIDVLKDAAAAAIYGSRGGNGVILVTTKRGDRTDNTRIELSSYLGFQEVTKLVDVLNKDEYIDYVTDAFANAGRPLPAMYNDPASLANTNWQREIFVKAPASNVQLSVSGGGSKSSFFVSGYATNQDGILKGTGFKRYGVRVNLDLRPLKWLDLGLTIAPSYSKTDIKPSQGTVNSAIFNTDFGRNPSSPSVGSPITLALLTPPIIPARLPNGDYGSNYSFPNYNTTINSLQTFNGQHYSPLQILDLYKDRYNSLRGLASGFIQARITENLTFKTSLGLETRSDERAWSIPATMGFDGGGSGANLSRPYLANVRANISKGGGNSWVWENTLNYNKSFDNKHNVDAIIGYAAQKSQSEAVSIESQPGTASNTSLDYPTNSTGINGFIQAYSANSLLSMFGRIQYNFNYKYMLSVAMRKDGSSRFGPNNRYATFPSVSVGWAIHEEGFAKSIFNPKYVNELKLRASWGKTGNYNIGDFTWQGLMGAANYPLGAGQGTVKPGFGQSSFYLPTLTWETNQQYNVGLDIRLLDNRIGLLVDYYDRTTDNLLLDANLPGVVGFANSIKSNVGKINNRGFEFAIASQNLAGKFSWKTDFNIALNKNKILSLAGDEPVFADVVGSPGYQNTIRHVVGGAIGDFYGLKKIGVYMNAEDLAKNPKWTGAQSSQVGDIKYADANGDGKIDLNDIVKIGSPHPKFIFGFVNSFKYKNADLTATVQGVYGGQIANAVVRYSNTFLGGDNPLAYAKDRWRSEAEPGNGQIPRSVAYTTNSPAPLAQFSSWNIYSASYVRISNVTLGYNFSSLLFKNTRGSKKTARLYGTVQNLATFSKYPGYNPDVNMYGKGDDARSGVDMGAYPLARRIVFGFTIGF